MAKKKSKTIDELRSANKALKKSLTSTRNQLNKTQARLDKSTGRVQQLRKEMDTRRAAATRSEAKVEKLTKKLDQARSAGRTEAREPVAVAAEIDPTEETAVGQELPGVDLIDETEPADGTEPMDETEPADEVAAVDESWTVVQLRAEARNRGISGMSNKPKAQLIAVLTR